ncbi:hypothetical protein E3N88_23428 [Mikania micrantha]|uniref:Uncharacterized protein n=1 Tax=Mikania micrantha TaxID=192012 RepID=A0A5N6NF75_9ASTR|nr:hypothetical protein E3N88_23428 [Mikania micrantha]
MRAGQGTQPDTKSIRATSTSSTQLHFSIISPENSIDEALKLLGSHWSIEGSLELITINTPPLEATKSLFPATLGAAKSLIQLHSSDLEHLR